MFTAARKNRVYHDIVEQIRDAIIRGKLQPGDRLPPERTLQEVFETSRITVREALRVLEHEGVLEIRTGSKGGAYVREPSINRVQKSLSMLIEYRNVPLSELAEFREDIEGSVTTLAARRAKRGDLDDLEKVFSRFRGICGEGVSRWADMLAADDEFHMALARASHNVLYEIVLEAVHTHIGLYYNRYLKPDENLIQKDLDDLAAIYGAVMERDSEKAETLARVHVADFNRIMIESYEGKLDTMLNRETRQ